MARMIPLHIPPTTDSAAERTLFDELERSCSADWIVLHSLDLAQRGTGPLGEADFVGKRAGVRRDGDRGQDAPRAHV